MAGIAAASQSSVCSQHEAGSHLAGTADATKSGSHPEAEISAGPFGGARWLLESGDRPIGPTAHS